MNSKKIVRFLTLITFMVAMLTGFAFTANAAGTGETVDQSSEVSDDSSRESSDDPVVSDDESDPAVPLSAEIDKQGEDVQTKKDFVVTVNAVGGTGEYKYTYMYMRNYGSLVSVAQNVDKNTYTYKFDTAGTYLIVVNVTDSDGAYTQVSEKVNVYDKLSDNGTKLNNTAVKIGGKIIAKSSFKGGVEPYTYRYSYKKENGAWVVASDFSKHDSYTYTFPKAAAYYTIRVTVKDARGNTLSKNINAAVTNPTGKSLSQSKSKISATNVALGGSIKTTAAVTGGTAPYKYYVSYRSGTGDWIKADEHYKYENTTVFNMPKKAGKYTVRIGVKDYTGKYIGKTFTVNVKTLSLNNTKTNITTAKIKQNVTLTAKTQYNYGKVQYRYSYHKSGKSWTYAGSYTSSSKHSFKFSAAGTYYVRVQAKDSAGKVISKQFKITVKQLNISGSKVSSSLLKAGSKTKLTAKTSYASGTAKYRYSYHKEGKSWTYSGGYTTASTHNFKFNGNGVYYVRVQVKDGTGKVLAKQFKINVYNKKTSTTRIYTTLQKSAGWKYASVSGIPKNTKVNVIKQSGNWYMVRYKKTVGYIYNRVFGGGLNYSVISKSTLPTIADDIIFTYGKSIPNLYNYVNSMSYSNASNGSLEDLCVYILKYRRGACYQRAALLYYLLDRAGFQTVRINDGIDKYTGGSPHNWCMVKTSSGWKHIDPTPVIGLGKMYLVNDARIAPYFSWNRNKYPKAP